MLEEKWQKLLSSDDHLSLVVGVHKEAGSLLSLLINENLVDGHLVELDRLNFPVRVDLAIALGGLSKKYRGGLLKLNSIRNEFAHGERSELDVTIARDLQNATDPSFLKIALSDTRVNEENWLTVFRTLLAINIVVVAGALNSVRERKIHSQAMSEEISEALRSLPQNARDFLRKGQAEAGDKIAERIERIRQKRGSN